MLTDDRVARVWEYMIAAETRALYFGDWGTRYTRRKQWITAVSFFLQSGAAATIAARAPMWVPLLFALTGVATSAYAIAVNLDGKITTMAKLHAAWHGIALQYEQLWNHVWADDAEDQFTSIVARERDPSELAVGGAPYDKHRLSQWQDHVLAMHHVKTAA